MSNVVALFKPKPELADVRVPIISAITDWAEQQGADINHPHFMIRVADVMTMIQIIANDCRK